MASSTAPLIINYNSRDFDSLRTDLINYAKTRHADKFAYENDANPDVMYLELLAYIGDTLNFQTDKSFNEVFRGTAQSRESLIRIAQDYGFFNYYPTPATMQAVVSMNIPAKANTNGSAMTPDPNYLLTLYAGLKIQANNGTYFECLDEINFGDSLNRQIIPNLDANNQLVDYTIKKSIVLIAGETKVQRFYVSSDNIKPFLEVLLSDTQVTEVIGVVASPGNTYDIPTDDQFRDINNVYVEVEHLSQDKIFAEINPLPPDTTSLVNAYTDMTIHYGEWINKPKRFIVKRDKDNNTSLVFGSTLVDYSTWNETISGVDITTLANFSLSQVLNNMALGEVPPVNSTLFIKYRNGAGSQTSVLTTQTLNVVDKNFSTASSAANLAVLQSVRNSLNVASTTIATGGIDALSNEELRQSMGKAFSANDRAVTYEDVQALIRKMPAKYGQPFRISYEEIKPQLMNYNQVKGFLDQKLLELLNLTTSTEREAKVQEIQTYIDSLPTQIASISSENNSLTNLGDTSDNILDNAPSLWIGEKCRLHILGIDEDNNPVTIYKDDNGIWQYPNELMKVNIKNWLVEKRVIGDWIDIIDARVVNFQIKVTILADKKNKQKVIVDCLTKLRSYFDVRNWQINQPIFISNVITVLQEINDVINVVDIKFYNIFDKDIETGKVYSPAEIGRYRNNKSVAVNSFNNKFEMNSIDNVIVPYSDTFLSVRYPDIDIVVGAI